MRFLVAILAILLAMSTSRAADVIVKDGGTLQLAGITYRLDGIDAPDFDQMCIDEHADPWACGVEARDQLANLVGKRGVRCENLGPDKIYSKRRAGVCTVDGETLSLNQLLVRQGFALNVERDASGRFKEDESGAKDARKGLWKGCFVAPQEFRRWNKGGVLLGASCRSDKDRELREALFSGDPGMPPGCTIKAKFATRAHVTGHVGIYHMRGCRSYASLAKPDRWFCSEEDAQAARFRKAFNCGRRR